MSLEFENLFYTDGPDPCKVNACVFFNGVLNKRQAQALEEYIRTPLTFPCPRCKTLMVSHRERDPETNYYVYYHEPPNPTCSY